MEVLSMIIKLIYSMVLLAINPITIILFICFYIKNKKYKEESYYKITKISFFAVRRDTGRYGEYLTYKYLKDYERDGAKFLFNIYIPKIDEATTEIDVLMISRKGLFVFESKNYSGWIFGNANQRYWYQTLPSGRGRSHKERFYNPVFQNNTHIKYLKKILGENIPIYSIITFSDRCTLKNVDVENSNVKVINRYQVNNLMSSIFNENPNDSLLDIQIDEIYNLLYPHTQVDDAIRQKHIENIINNYVNIDKNTISEVENNKEVNENPLTLEENNYEQNNTSDNDSNSDVVIQTEESLVCPLCGSKLVLRLAKKGSHKGENFYGCSHFPMCKYKRKINTTNE